MSSTTVVQLTLLKLKPDAHLDEVGSPAGDALLDVISVVKKADSRNRAFFGHQLENPDIGVLVFVYPSVEASQVFSTASAPKLSTFGLSASTRTFEFSSADVLSEVLTSPTTEIATAYGIEEGYVKNVHAFSEILTKELKGNNAGFHGSTVGTTVSDISKEEGGEKGPAAVLIVGWDNREAHMAGRGVGAIPENFGLIRTLRKDMDMWHVNFKEY